MLTSKSLGGMESEPMLTPKGKIPSTRDSEEPRMLHHAGQRAQHTILLTELLRPRIVYLKISLVFCCFFVEGGGGGGGGGPHIYCGVYRSTLCSGNLHTHTHTHTHTHVHTHTHIHPPTHTHTHTQRNACNHLNMV